MAIQMRRGAYNKFDPTKLVAGEYAVVQSGDEQAKDGKAVYMAFAAGDVKRLATYEDMVDDCKQAIIDDTAAIAADLTKQVTATDTAVKAAESKRVTEFATLKKESQTATAAAEKVNATLDGTKLTVTSRDGSTATVDTKGERGETGATGAKGDKGDKGDKGETGATGATGAKGDKGDKGDTGAKGADGEVTLAYLKANCPVTYFLTGFGAAATPWHRLGTMSATYKSASATINVWSGNGFNGKASQNSGFQIMVKRGDKTGTTTDTTFGATVTYGLNCAGCDVRVIATDASTCDIWAKLPWDYPAGRYDVEGYKVTWTDHGSDAPQADEPTGAVQSLASYTLMTTDNAELEYDRQVARGTYAGRSIQTILGCSSWADTYAALHAKVAAADFSGLRVGDYMDVTFTGTDLITTATQRFVLAHFDPYLNTGATALTSHHLAFVAQKAVTVASGVTGYVNNGRIQWNTTATNNGTSAQPAPYIASNLHAFETKLAAELPSSISGYVISRTARLETRYSSSGTLTDSNGSVIVAIGQLWSMSQDECLGGNLFGTRTVPRETQAFDFMLKSVNDRAALRSSAYWLRDAQGGSNSGVAYYSDQSFASVQTTTWTWAMPRPCFLFA